MNIVDVQKGPCLIAEGNPKAMHVSSEAAARWRRRQQHSQILADQGGHAALPP
jgi:hypothetical protein